MKRLRTTLFALAASAAMFSTGHAAVLFNNSNITTGTANGANGANTSSIAANSTSYGYTSNSASLTYQIADDFTLAGTSAIGLITFDAYSTGTYPANPASPFTGATVNIWNGQPGAVGSSILFTSTTLATTAWTGVYRVTSTTLTNAQRPVFSLSVSFTGVTLPAGTYWAAFAATSVVAPGSAASVFTPPVMATDGTLPVGNALQSADGGATWISATDATAGYAIGVPLIVASPVPEPATVAGTLLGIAAVAAARRRMARA